MENFDFLLEQPDFINQIFILPANNIALSGVSSTNNPNDIKQSQGKNNQYSDNPKALICVFKETNKITDYSFLIRILQAVDLQLVSDCNLYECTENESLSLHYIYNNTPVKIVLFFGISPQNAGLQNDWKKYKPYRLADSYFLCADRLETIENDANLKKNLWACLKFVFNK